MKRIFTISLGVGLAASMLTLSLLGKSRIIDREAEKKQYPDLQKTEADEDLNVEAAYKRLTLFGTLVNMAREDRDKYFKERQEPNEFRHTLRNIVYTPRNTYVRYVKDDPAFMLVGFGNPAETQERIQEKVKEAVDAGIQVAAPTFSGQREGIELTQFEFIYPDDEPGREAVGSKRKSLTLFFKRTGQGTVDTETDFTLDYVVTRIIEDNFKKGVKDMELVIDPTPGTKEMDDVIIVHRYNQKTPQAMVVGAMPNTPNFPQRLDFKRKFYVRLMDHYNILFRLVDGYAKKDSNNYQDSVLEHLRRSTEY